MSQHSISHRILLNFVSLAEGFLHNQHQPINYQQICGEFIKVTESSYCVFRLNSDDNTYFETAAFCGKLEGLAKARAIFNEHELTSIWETGEVLDHRIDSEDLLYYEDFAQLIKPLIGEATASELCDQLQIKAAYVLKVHDQQHLFGSLLFVMDRDQPFTKHTESLLFGQLLGLFLSNHKANAAAEAASNQFKQLVEFLPDALYAVDNEGKIIIWNNSMEQLTKIASEAMIGKGNFEYTIPFYGERRPNLLDLLDKSDEELQNKYRDVLRQGKTVEGYAYCQAMHQGKGGWIFGKACYLYDHQQRIIGKVEVVRDITEQRLYEERLIESEQNYKALFDFSDVGIGYYTVDGYVISFNKKAAQNMGGRIEDFVGKYILDLFPRETGEKFLKRLHDVAGDRVTRNYEDFIEVPGSAAWFYSTHTAIIDLKGHVKGIQIISQNISAIKQKEMEITYLSYHDQLTGLYNRRFFEEELLRLDVPRNWPLTIAMGDVNGLKLINDSFGHQVGDQLLISIANVMKRVCRQDDIVARWGGDEFAIIFPSTSEQDAEQIVKRIISAAQREKIGQLPVSVSFGYATKYMKDEEIQNILKQSEDYMYQHKLHESTSARNSMINLIMNALVEKNEREMEHSRRVSETSVEIAMACGFDNDKVNLVKTIGLLHDIGKIGIEESILNSVEKLSEEALVSIRKHTEIGYRILCSATDFMEIANDVYEHHERWDGSGYPRGLKGEEISVNARIVAIADSYDAMISDRPSNYYKKPMSEEEAITEIKTCAGKQFDPKLAKIFIRQVLKQAWEED